MAGTLTISTLSDGTNSTSSTNCIKGSAKAWINFNGVSGSVAIRASYNCSSVTRSSAGQYVVNFTNALADANYAVAGSAQNSAGINSNVIYGSNSGATALTTTSFPIANYNSGNATFDSSVVTAIVCGN